MLFQAKKFGELPMMARFWRAGQRVDLIHANDVRPALKVGFSAFQDRLGAVMGVPADMPVIVQL